MQVNMNLAHLVVAPKTIRRLKGWKSTKNDETLSTYASLAHLVVATKTIYLLNGWKLALNAKKLEVNMDLAHLVLATKTIHRLKVNKIYEKIITLNEKIMEHCVNMLF